jgi:hypothetical protein
MSIESSRRRRIVAAVSSRAGPIERAARGNRNTSTVVAGRRNSLAPRIVHVRSDSSKAHRALFADTHKVIETV